MNWRTSTIAVIFFLILSVWQQWPDDKLRVVFCDVGQGDGAVVLLGEFQAVIDTGASKQKIIECLSDVIPFWDREIEVVFISHSDKDHAGALGEIRERYDVQRVVENPRYKDVVRYGELSFDILKGAGNVAGVSTDNDKEDNKDSVVMRLDYGEFSVLFTGDIDIDTELALGDMGVLEPVDVLKVAHHGSKYSTGSMFLDEIKPKIAVISVGEKNTYGHPSRDILIRLDTVNTKVFRTDLHGKVTISTDGEKIWTAVEKMELD